GSTSYVILSSSSGLPSGSQPHTVVGWFKPNSYGSRVAMSWGTEVNNQGRWVSAGNASYSNHVSAGFWNNNADSGQSISLNSWHHLAFIFDGNTTVTFIIDNGAPITKTVAQQPDTVLSSARIGSLLNSGYYYDGLIDDVRIYNRALSAAEIQNLYQAGQVIVNGSQATRLTSGLVGYWSFNGPDVDGTTAYDRSGNANNGTLSGGVKTAIGKSGQALSFDGGSGYVNVGNTASLDITGAITMSVWVNSATATSLGRIVAKGTYGGSQLGYSLQLYPSTGGKVSFIVSDGSEAIIKSNASITDGVWNHIVGVRDASGNMKLYVNNVQQTETATKTGSMSNIYPLAIGVSNTTALREYFNATIDEVRIYNRALSASEVQQLYNMGK
ncbi:MAG: LamG domain-containing protein, partial [bacterium]|nr:LamG domain-containing protein [bacterium]